MLLDPSDGAHGIRQQIEAAATELHADDIRLVDVGGDLLGQPGDAGLRSPFGDALTAAGCLELPMVSWVAGPGLDGELSEDTVCGRAGENSVSHTISPESWKPYLPTFGWHPTEATALLAAATLGARGTVEIREAGLPVRLTERSPTVLEIGIDTVGDINPLISQLAGTRSFEDAERLAVQLMGATELDAERVKAARPRRQQPPPTETISALRSWETAARARGIDFVTYRRLAEALHHPDVAALRAAVIAHQPERDTGLLWEVADHCTAER
ncbi:hypothetical protein GCM10009828_104530 [Actinoplanes couchii]|uniref:Uncharacterized protein n=1 Tax=Actinoplanes couchii TaxID=403638 RepID=A0ABQ3XL88_9ACTN|nr:hypothetical protein Aco03nite_076550 [Actinoplanes couchii]